LSRAVNDAKHVIANSAFKA